MPAGYTNAAQSILVDLDLDKVALCNQGANSRAHILLTKRKENDNMPKTFEEIMAGLEPAHAEVVKAHIDTIEKTKDTAKEEEVTKLNATITTLNTEITTLKDVTKNVPAKDNSEDILKAVSPEVAAYVEELKKSVGALVADKEEAIAKARFEEVKAIPVEEETLKSVLKSASPAVFEVLKKAATAVSTAVLTAKGKETAGDDFKITADTAYATLEKSARDIMTKNTSLSFEQAFTEACSADPATYTKYYSRGDN